MRCSEKKIGVILSYVILAANMLVQLLYTPVVLNLLGQSDYGLFTLSNSVISYLSLFSLGFGSAYVRFFSRYKVRGDDDGIARLNRTFISVFSVLGLLAAVAGVILISNVDIVFFRLTAGERDRAKLLFGILLCNLVLSFPYSVFYSYITANEKFYYPKVVELCRIIFSPFVSLPLLLSGYGSVGYVLVSVGFSFFSYVINIAFAFKKLRMKFGRGKADLPLVKEIASFSFFIFLYSITEQINWNIDKFLLGFFQGTLAVAVYGVASTIHNIVESFSVNISSVFVPQINLLVFRKADTRELTGIMARVGRVQLFVLALLLSGLVFFGRPFIHLWAGPEYDAAYLIVLLLCLPAVISLIQTVGVQIQRAMNLHRYTAYVYVAMGVFNLCISIPLTKYYGAIGAAFGTAVSVLIGKGLVMNLMYKYMLKLQIGYYWKEIIKALPSFVVPFTFGYYIICNVDLYNWTSLIVWIAVYSIVYVLSIFCVGMNKFEHNLIVRPIAVFLRGHGVRFYNKENLMFSIKESLRKTRLWGCLKKAPVAYFVKNKKRIRTVISRYGYNYTFHLAYDMVKEFIKHDVPFEEYFLFDFPHTAEVIRRTFVTDIERRSLLAKINNPENEHIFDDKGLTYRLFKKFYKRDLVSMPADGREAFNAFVKAHPRFIGKPLDSTFGRGVKIYETSGMSPAAVYNEISSYYMGPFVMEEIVIQHHALAKLHSCSLNTLRMATIVVNGQASIFFAFLRVGVGSNIIDNAGGGDYM